MLAKFKNDVEACTDVVETGVPRELIAKIFLCCNSTVTPADWLAVAEMATQIEVPIEVISLSTLALGIQLRHPAIPRTLLGIEVGTGQLLTMEEFVREYQKLPTATALTYPIYGSVGHAFACNDFCQSHA